MKEYNEDDVIRLAKRINNNKRGYLIVDPLQGKHIPVSPSVVCEMSKALGELLLKTAGESRLIIGFAETATALGAIAAMSFPDDAVYLHTTREKIASGNIVSFCEEHSHAVDQIVECSYISSVKTPTVIMIDDEISTGRTIENIVTGLRETFPFLKNVGFVIGSIINRMSGEVRERLLAENIEFVSLINTNAGDYEEQMKNIPVESPQTAEDIYSDYITCVLNARIPDLRTGMTIAEMKQGIDIVCEEINDILSEICRGAERLLVLGTEECMTAAIETGKYIESRHSGMSVFTHSTTRSPIGINSEKDYPCRNGYILPSFYDSARTTFLYNIDSYDAVLLITDSKNEPQINTAMDKLAGVFREHCSKIILIRG